MSSSDPPARSDLPRQSVRGGALVLVAQAANMVIGFGSVAVLGRLLTPDHFGLVVIAT